MPEFMESKEVGRRTKLPCGGLGARRAMRRRAPSRAPLPCGGAQFVLGLSVSRSPRHTLHTEGRPTRSHFVQCMHARWNGDRIGLYKRE